MAKLVKKYFTSNGSWVAPAGVTEVLLIGSGGGGAGGGASANNANGVGGSGGGGCLQVSKYVTVVPNTSYTVTIGAGGVGTGPVTNGNDGGDTTFGSLFTALGAQGGPAAINGGFQTPPAGGLCIRSTSATLSQNIAACVYVFNAAATSNYMPAPTIASGGPGTDNVHWSNGMSNPNGYLGGVNGTMSGSAEGGGGGGAGPQGAGGNGGNANNAGTGGSGTSAAANSGAGGGGSGCSSNAGVGVTSGSGGSGYLYVVYVD